MILLDLLETFLLQLRTLFYIDEKNKEKPLNIVLKPKLHITIQNLISSIIS